MQISVMQVENIAQRRKPENPVVAFDIDQRLIDRVTEGGDNAPQDSIASPLQERWPAGSNTDRDERGIGPASGHL